MESFKLYLPSNASVDHFPNNTPSNFQTHLSDPIQLEGNWEAGLESIFYSSKIGNDDEIARVRIDTKTEYRGLATLSYPLRYKLENNDKWKTSAHITKDYMPNVTFNTRENVANLLTTINRSILREGDMSNGAFNFRKEGKYIVFEGATNGVVVDISITIARYLGFGWQHIFCGKEKLRAIHKPVIPLNNSLSHNDYRVHFADTNVLKRATRLIVKNPGFGFPKSKEILEQALKSVITSKYNIELKFHTSGKLIVKNFEDNLILRFSKDFSKTFHIAEAIIGKKEEWATNVFNPDNAYTDDFWYLDIFLDDIASMMQPLLHSVLIEFSPRRFIDAANIIPMLNKAILERLKLTTFGAYVASSHRCEFSLVKNHTRFELGNWITAAISPNLAFLLGFDVTTFKGEGVYVSKRLPATLEQREQHLFILSDIIQHTSFGDKKVDILQEFVHESSDSDQKRLIEKRFHPITYSPVKTCYIENVSIKVANELFQPVFINDSKTVAIIHFRKCK